MSRLFLCLLGVTLAAPTAKGDPKEENQASVAAAARGDYPAARRHASQALAQARAANDLRAQSQAFNNLANADIYSGDYVTAERLLQRALEISRQGGFADLEAEQLTNVGGVQLIQGRYDESLASYRAAGALAATRQGAWVARRRRLIQTNLAVLNQRLGQNEAALDIYRSMLAQPEQLEPVERAQALVNLGVCYRRLGDPVKALETYARAQALFAESHHLDGELGVGKNRGIVLALDLGELERAREVFLENRKRAATAGNRREELQALLYAAECAYRLGSAQALREFADSWAIARVIGAKEEEWKGLFGHGRAAARSGDREGAFALLAEAAGVVESLRSTVGIDARVDFFADKRAVYDALVDLRFDQAFPEELFDWMERARARVFQDRLAAARPTLRDLQAKLDPRTAVLFYWRSRDKGAVVWITASGSGKRRFQLAPESVASYAAALRSPSSQWEAAAREIGGVLLPPGLSAARIAISPSGDLAGIPFETLAPSGEMLLRSAEVFYAPAAAVLARPTAGSRWIMPWRREFAGFGDPKGGLSDPATPPLPLAEREVRSAAAALGGKSALYIGEANRRSAFVDDGMRRAPVLHLATHAVSDPLFPERSRLVFSHGDSVYLRQLAGLDMRSTHLAVLSACETESGRVLEGEGAQTFGRALLANGVRSSVTSLWRVEDSASARLMEVFYSGMASGQTGAEALRHAKLALRETKSHPAYWAGFVLNGDGRYRPPRPVGWWPFASVFAGIAVALAARRIRGQRTSDAVATAPPPEPVRPGL